MEEIRDINTIDRYTVNKDRIVQEEESNRVGLLTTTEKGSELSAEITAVSANVQAGMVGVEAKISIVIEDIKNK